MSNAKPQATGFLKCMHCGNFAPMDIVANYYRSTKPEPDPEAEYYKISNEYYDEYYNHLPNQGYTYNLLLCLACKKVTLQKYFDADDMPDELLSIETLYPSPGLNLSQFPHLVQTAYEAALKARTIDANAYAILLGRMLEVVCEDRKVKGENLIDKLRVLAEKGEIPTNLVGVAHGLRMLRNVGVHEPLEGLTSEEIPILDDLSKAILEYIYIAPHLAEQAEMRLSRLKEKKRKEIKENLE